MQALRTSIQCLVLGKTSNEPFCDDFDAGNFHKSSGFAHWNPVPGPFWKTNGGLKVRLQFYYNHKPPNRFFVSFFVSKRRSILRRQRIHVVSPPCLDTQLSRSDHLAEWSEWLNWTSRKGGLTRRCRRRIDPYFVHFLLFLYSFFQRQYSSLLAKLFHLYTAVEHCGPGQRTHCFSSCSWVSIDSAVQAREQTYRKSKRFTTCQGVLKLQNKCRHFECQSAQTTL